jgi:hypothetical protein
MLMHIQSRFGAGNPTLPSWQHFFAGLTILLKCNRKNPVVEKIARYCVRVICEHHWQHKDGVLLELLDDNFRPYTFDAGNWGNFHPQGVSGWHSIQACWMVMNECTESSPIIRGYRKGRRNGYFYFKKDLYKGKGMPSDMAHGGLSLTHPGGRLNEDGNFVWGAFG